MSYEIQCAIFSSKEMTGRACQFSNVFDREDVQMKVRAIYVIQKARLLETTRYCHDLLRGPYLLAKLSQPGIRRSLWRGTYPTAAIIVDLF